MISEEILWAGQFYPYSALFVANVQKHTTTPCALNMYKIGSAQVMIVLIPLPLPMALNIKNRLKRKADLQKVFKKGKYLEGSFLFIKFIKNSLGLSRFGFVISSKVSKKAVTRNRTRRVLSEVVRVNMDRMNNNYDVIINIKKNVKLDLMKDDLINILNKLWVN